MELMSEKAEQERRLGAEKELERVIHRERGSKGRKRVSEQEGNTPRKRLRAESAANDGIAVVEPDADDAKPPLPVKGMKQNKLRLLPTKTKPVVVKEIPSFPCLFCPSLDAEDLLLVYEPSQEVKARSKSLGGGTLAHLSCANSIPEVWVEDRLVGEMTIPVVMGANGITKDRWNLVSSVSMFLSDLAHPRAEMPSLFR